ncbi:hypothetical protein K504DRAFT_350848, partial [Pleomassaria siparia CBS 279.74]
LLTTANKYDRFRLLNDPSTLESDLDNPVHAIFSHDNFDYGDNLEHGDFIHKQMQQTLRLASNFLQHDSVLEWFVAPLMGRPLRAQGANGKSKTYLSNPLLNKSDAEKKQLINEVRKALHCLSGCITLSFINKAAVKIEIRPQYLNAYLNQYAESSRGKQFRHDFSFATTIVHEICHAVGVMRRGDMCEPYVQCEHPVAEMGFAWENFMFGAIMNPVDQESDTTNFMTRRVWAEPEAYEAAGGKEWATVPISYIARWFRKDTWDTIAQHGPSAIPPPHTELKMKQVPGRFTIYSDTPEKLAYIQAYKDSWALVYPERYVAGEMNNLEVQSTFVNVEVVSTDALQKTAVPVPPR